MSRFSDSRDPAGVGFLILRDTGYKAKGLTDANRGGLVGVEVAGRRDGESEDGKWIENKDRRGNLGGAVFWERKRERAGAYQFAWASVIDRSGQGPRLEPADPGGPVTDRPRPSVTQDPRTSGGLNGGGGKAAPGADFLPGVFDPGTGTRRVDNQLITDLRQIPGLIPIPRIFVGVNPPILIGQGGGPFGINVPALGVGFPTPPGGVPIFGIGVPALTPIWVFPRDPSGNPTTAGPRSPSDGAVAAWYSGGQSQASFPAQVRPTTSRWLGDDRYRSTRVGKPVGWPDFPGGYQTITLDSSEEEQQVELTLSGDPRIIAPSRAGLGALGSLVSDVDPLASIDTDAQARVHGFWRVVKGPTGKMGLLRANSRDGKGDEPGGFSNVLSWNIGPAGTWETFGGMVTDFPESGKGINRDARVHAMASALLGGPFDCGPTEDTHDYGVDEDGNPIRPLHLSTEALIRRPFAGKKGFEDGPILWEREFREGGDLPEPVAVHAAFNPKSGRWQWWTTDIMYAVPPTITPRPEPDPQPEPEPGGAVTPRPVPPPVEGDPIPDPRAALDDDISFVSADPRENANRGGSYFSRAAQSGNRDPRWIAATRVETGFASIVARPEPVQEGTQDVTGSWFYSASGRKEHDDEAPITARLVAYGAQGGEPGGSAMPGDKSWTHTQEPGFSMHRGGTAGGGFALIPPETLPSDHDADYAPDGISVSPTYCVAGPGAGIGTGKPGLVTGGIKEGWSLEDDSGDLVFYSHDSSEVKTERLRFTSAGQTQISDYADIYTKDASTSQATSTTPAKVTGFTSNGISRGAVPDNTTDDITIAKAGVYAVDFDVSFEGTAGRAYQIHLRVNAVEQYPSCRQYTADANEETMSFAGLLSLSENDVVTVYVESDAATTWTPIDMRLRVTEVL